MRFIPNMKGSSTTATVAVEAESTTGSITTTTTIIKDENDYHCNNNNNLKKNNNNNNVVTVNVGTVAALRQRFSQSQQSISTTVTKIPSPVKFSKQDRQQQENEKVKAKEEENPVIAYLNAAVATNSPSPKKMTPKYQRQVEKVSSFWSNNDSTTDQNTPKEQVQKQQQQFPRNASSSPSSKMLVQRHREAALAATLSLSSPRNHSSCSSSSSSSPLSRRQYNTRKLIVHTNIVDTTTNTTTTPKSPTTRGRKKEIVSHVRSRSKSADDKKKQQQQQQQQELHCSSSASTHSTNTSDITSSYAKQRAQILIEQAISNVVGDQAMIKGHKDENDLNPDDFTSIATSSSSPSSSSTTMGIPEPPPPVSDTSTDNTNSSGKSDAKIMDVTTGTAPTTITSQQQQRLPQLSSSHHDLSKLSSVAKKIRRGNSTSHNNKTSKNGTATPAAQMMSNSEKNIIATMTTPLSEGTASDHTASGTGTTATIPSEDEAVVIDTKSTTTTTTPMLRSYSTNNLKNWTRRQQRNHHNQQNKSSLSSSSIETDGRTVNNDETTAASSTKNNSNKPVIDVADILATKRAYILSSSAKRCTTSSPAATVSGETSNSNVSNNRTTISSTRRSRSISTIRTVSSSTSSSNVVDTVEELKMNRKDAAAKNTDKADISAITAKSNDTKTMSSKPTVDGMDIFATTRAYMLSSSSFKRGTNTSTTSTIATAVLDTPDVRKSSNVDSSKKSDIKNTKPFQNPQRRRSISSIRSITSSNAFKKVENVKENKNGPVDIHCDQPEPPVVVVLPPTVTTRSSSVPLQRPIPSEPIQISSTPTLPTTVLLRRAKQLIKSSHRGGGSSSITTGAKSLYPAVLSLSSSTLSQRSSSPITVTATSSMDSNCFVGGGVAPAISTMVTASLSTDTGNTTTTIVKPVESVVSLSPKTTNSANTMNVGSDDIPLPSGVSIENTMNVDSDDIPLLSGASLENTESIEVLSVTHSSNKSNDVAASDHSMLTDETKGNCRSIVDATIPTQLSKEWSNGTSYQSLEMETSKLQPQTVDKTCILRAESEDTSLADGSSIEHTESIEVLSVKHCPENAYDEAILGQCKIEGKNSHDSCNAFDAIILTQGSSESSNSTTIMYDYIQSYDANTECNQQFEIDNMTVKPQIVDKTCILRADSEESIDVLSEKLSRDTSSNDAVPIGCKNEDENFEIDSPKLVDATIVTHGSSESSTSTSILNDHIKSTNTDYDQQLKSEVSEFKSHFVDKTYIERADSEDANACMETTDVQSVKNSPDKSNDDTAPVPDYGTNEIIDGNDYIQPNGTNTGCDQELETKKSELDSQLADTNFIALADSKETLECTMSVEAQSVKHFRENSNDDTTPGYGTKTDVVCDNSYIVPVVDATSVKTHGSSEASNSPPVLTVNDHIQSNDTNTNSNQQFTHETPEIKSEVVDKIYLSIERKKSIEVLTSKHSTDNSNSGASLSDYNRTDEFRNGCHIIDDITASRSESSNSTNILNDHIPSNDSDSDCYQQFKIEMTTVTPQVSLGAESSDDNGQRGDSKQEIYKSASVAGKIENDDRLLESLRSLSLVPPPPPPPGTKKKKSRRSGSSKAAQNSQSVEQSDQQTNRQFDSLEKIKSKMDSFITLVDSTTIEAVASPEKNVKVPLDTIESMNVDVVDEETRNYDSFDLRNDPATLRGAYSLRSVTSNDSVPLPLTTTMTPTDDADNR